MATTTSKPESTPRSPAEPVAVERQSSLLSLVSVALALAGAGVAGYLTSVHYDRHLLLCGGGNCGTVQQSTYAEMAGVPVALLGLLMYLAILSLGVIRWHRPDLQSNATMAAFAIALAGTVFAVYLTYLEIWVIDAICQWCVVSALLTFGILAGESLAVWRILGMPDS